MKTTSLELAKDLVKSIYYFASENQIQKSIESFGFKELNDLESEIASMIDLHAENHLKFNYFAMYFSDLQMSIFTTFEEKIRGMFGCSKQIIMLSDYNI
jgi:hypothetical protein